MRRQFCLVLFVAVGGIILAGKRLLFSVFLYNRVK